MTVAELGAIGEFVGSIAVLVTLIYLSVQIRQNTRHARAQMANDAWLSLKDDEIAAMGDNPAEALAKLGLRNASLTDAELKVVDAHFRSLVFHSSRVEYATSLGLEIYTVSQTGRWRVELLNSPIGRTWWKTNRSFVESLIPTIGAHVDGLLEAPDCPSSSESFRELRKQLPG